MPISGERKIIPPNMNDFYIIIISIALSHIVRKYFPTVFDCGQLVPHNSCDIKGIVEIWLGVGVWGL